MNKFIKLDDLIMEIDKINIDALELQGRLLENNQIEYAKMMNRLTDEFDKIIDELEEKMNNE